MTAIFRQHLTKTLDHSTTNFCSFLSNFAFLVEMSAGFRLVSTYVHSTSWKYSAWKKFSLYFLYIFIADRNFLTNFCSSDPSFNRNILISLYLKSETSALAQLCDYMFIHTIYKFHGMVLTGNLNWASLFINEVYR